MVDVLVQAGSLLLQHGADAGRVEASLQQMEQGLGIDRIDAVVMSKTILLTATRQDAHHTRIARVPMVGVNMNALSDVEQLLGRFQQGQVTPEQLRQALQHIAALPHHYPRDVHVAATGMACAAFCQLFGGDWAALIITGVASAAAAWVRMELNRRRMNYFMVVLLTALVASLVAGSALWLSQTPQSALTAAVLLLVPGVPLINASIDLLRGYISAGLARAATSLMVFLGIALGLGVVLRLLEVRLQRLLAAVTEVQHRVEAQFAQGQHLNAGAR
ncbi:MAG TPA: threonine/serine exporter family protein [Candidatus Competibacteraceae bacterium]|nr:threonine/serine exporter family protein [Candidatus Competibacteraceae bacterium]